MGRKLDVGCGNTITPGYERLDINASYPNLDFITELDEIPVDDGMFEVVRASHVIEHVPLDRVRGSVLPEWLRVLQPGGRVVIDTPNIERNARMYADGSWKRDFANLKEAEQQRCSINGEPDRSLWLNFKVFSTDAVWNVHYWNATPELLATLVLEAGFEEATVQQSEPSVIVIGRKAG